MMLLMEEGQRVSAAPKAVGQLPVARSHELRMLDRTRRLGSLSRPNSRINGMRKLGRKDITRISLHLGSIPGLDS